MAKTWRCGDCGTEYPMNVHRCQRPLDDYLALRGGSVEESTRRAVEKATAPHVEAAYRRLNTRRDDLFPLAG